MSDSCERGFCSLGVRDDLLEAMWRGYEKSHTAKFSYWTEDEGLGELYSHTKIKQTNNADSGRNIGGNNAPSWAFIFSSNRVADLQGGGFVCQKRQTNRNHLKSPFLIQRLKRGRVKARVPALLFICSSKAGPTTSPALSSLFKDDSLTTALCSKSCHPLWHQSEQQLNNLFEQLKDYSVHYKSTWNHIWIQYSFIFVLRKKRFPFGTPTCTVYHSLQYIKDTLVNKPFLTA